MSIDTNQIFSDPNYNHPWGPALIGRDMVSDLSFAEVLANDRETAQEVLSGKDQRVRKIVMDYFKEHAQEDTYMMSETVTRDHGIVSLQFQFTRDENRATITTATITAIDPHPNPQLHPRNPRIYLIINNDGKIAEEEITDIVKTALLERQNVKKPQTVLDSKRNGHFDIKGCEDECHLQPPEPQISNPPSAPAPNNVPKQQQAASSIVPVIKKPQVPPAQQPNKEPQPPKTPNIDPKSIIVQGQDASPESCRPCTADDCCIL